MELKLISKVKNKIDQYKLEHKKELTLEEEKVLQAFFTKQVYLKDLYLDLMKNVGLKKITYTNEKNNLELHYLIDTATNNDKQIMVISKLNQIGTSLTTFELPPELVPYIVLWYRNKDKYNELIAKTQIDFKKEKAEFPNIQKLLDRKIVTYDVVENGVLKQPKWSGFGNMLSFTATNNIVVAHTMSIYKNEFVKVNSIYYSLEEDLYFDNESLLLPLPVVKEIVQQYENFLIKHKNLKVDDNKTVDLKGELQMIQFQLNQLEKRKKEIEDQLKQNEIHNSKEKN